MDVYNLKYSYNLYSLTLLIFTVLHIHSMHIFNWTGIVKVIKSRYLYTYSKKKMKVNNVKVHNVLFWLINIYVVLVIYRKQLQTGLWKDCLLLKIWASLLQIWKTRCHGNWGLIGHTSTTWTRLVNSRHPHHQKSNQRFYKYKNIIQSTISRCGTQCRKCNK